MPAAEVIPLTPAGAKSERLSESQPVQPEHDEQRQHAELDHHHDRVDLRRLARAAEQQQRAQHDQDHGGDVEDAALLRRLRRRVGDREAEQVVEQLVEVLRPADGDRGGRHAVLEQQAGGDDHRDALAQRRVGVGVRRAGDRDGAGQLGVADGRQPGDRAGHDERQDHRGPADRHGLREDDEDAGADRGADAEQRQLEQPDACARARPRLAVGRRSPPSSPRRACAAGPAPSGTPFAPLPPRSVYSMSRASRSAHVSRRTTSRAAPSAANTTGMRRVPL